MLQDTTGQSRILNARTLTTISNTLRDRDVITPNYLLLLKSINSLAIFPKIFIRKIAVQSPTRSCKKIHKTMLFKGTDIYRTTVRRRFWKILT